MDPLERLKDLAVSDRGFVFDPHTGATFSVNPSGLAVLRGLQEGLPRARIALLLEESFETARADLERDVDEFVSMLRNQGIVPKSFHA